MLRTSTACLVLACAIASSADPEDASSTIRAGDLRAHVEFLASDDLEGRATLQRGNDIAAKYLAAQMRRIGLSPAGADGTYFQDVPLWVSSYKYQYFLELRHDGPGRRSEFEGFKDFSIVPGSGHDTVEGGVVFAGYGITAPEYGWDDYAGLEVKGKVVVVFRHEPREADEKSVFDGAKATKHSSFEEKIRNAAAHGAAAVLILNDPLGGHDPLFERADVVPDQMVHRTSVTFEEGVEPKNAQGGTPALFVDLPTACTILGRSAQEIAGLQREMDREMKPQGFEAEGKLKVRSQVFGRLQTTELKRSRNVAGLVPGSDPSKMKEVVVVGAHYDHVGIFGSGDDTIHNGADDNASGTAGILEIAEAVASMRERPARSILFVCFTGEEMGLLGSQYYAKHPLFPLDDTVAMLNLDMIGRWSRDDPANARQVVVAGITTSPSWRDLLEKHRPSSGLEPVYSPEDPGGSDHIPFRNARIPSIFFFTGFHKDYHGVGDTSDKIDFEKAALVARFAYRVTCEVAGRGRRPEFRDPKEARPERVEQAPRVSHGDDLVLRVLSEEEARKAGLENDVLGLRVHLSKRPDLREGDVILEVADEPVKDVEGFLKALEKGKGGTLSLFVMREGVGCVFVHLKGKDLEGWVKP